MMPGALLSESFSIAAAPVTGLQVGTTFVEPET
jgi:hypothetical protein